MYQTVRQGMFDWCFRRLFLFLTRWKHILGAAFHKQCAYACMLCFVWSERYILPHWKHPRIAFSLLLIPPPNKNKVPVNVYIAVYC